MAASSIQRISTAMQETFGFTWRHPCLPHQYGFYIYTFLEIINCVRDPGCMDYSKCSLAWHMSYGLCECDRHNHFLWQYGRLRLVQWLVENTGVRDKVRCKDGERSLLHIAAKYAQEEVSVFYCQSLCDIYLYSIVINGFTHLDKTFMCINYCIAIIQCLISFLLSSPFALI